MMNLIIKNEKTQDIEAIRNINIAAFDQETEAEIVVRLMFR